MKENGAIVIGYDERTGHPVNFKWQGGRVARVSIRTLLQLHVNMEHKYFWIGPFWVMNLGYGEQGQLHLVVMRSGGLLTDIAGAWLFGLQKWLKLVNARVLWTLEIWNLLKRPSPGCYPVWADLKAFRLGQHIYRRFFRWLTARYVASSRTREGLEMVLTVRPYDPLFWLWLFLRHP